MEIWTHLFCLYFLCNLSGILDTTDTSLMQPWVCHHLASVPVALEEFAGDLETETKEEVDNQELAKGNGMLEINHSKRNIICIFLILQFTSLIVSRKKLITAQITFLSARRFAPHSGPELAWCCVAGCDPRGGLDMSNLYNMTLWPTDCQRRSYIYLYLIVLLGQFTLV